MKIRNGFVSNSSSSSFTVLLTKEDFEKIERSLSILDAAVVRAVGVNDKNFLGHNCVTFGYVSGNYSTMECIEHSEIMDHAEKIAQERGEELQEDFEENIGEESWASLGNCWDEIRKLSKDKRFMHEEDF